MKPRLTEHKKLTYIRLAIIFFSRPRIGNNTSTTICLFVFVYSYNKVNRSLAIYSPRTTTTNQQGHQMNRPICAQERIFWAKFGLSWAKNPNFNKRKQKLCHPHNRKNTWAPCSHCFSVSMGHIWPKMSILGQIWTEIPKFYRSK